MFGLYYYHHWIRRSNYFSNGAQNWFDQLLNIQTDASKETHAS